MLLQIFVEGIHFLHGLDKYPLAFEAINQVLINLLGEKIIWRLIFYKEASS